MSDSVRPQRRQPIRLPCPWDSPGKKLEWVAISFASAWKWKVKVKLLSHVRLVVTPWTAAHQAPPSMGFSRKEYWSGCHCLLRQHSLKITNSPIVFEFIEGPYFYFSKKGKSHFLLEKVMRTVCCFTWWKNPVSYILTPLTRPLAQWQLKLLTKHCENSSSD